MLIEPNYYNSQLKQYSKDYAGELVTILVDRMPLSDEDINYLKLLFPNSRIIYGETLCGGQNKDFFSLTEDSFLIDNICILLETSAKRIDYLTKILCNKGLKPNKILTSASEYAKICNLKQIMRFQHFDTNVFTKDTFSRYAILVRLMFIEEYFGCHSDGYELYRKYLQAKNYGPFEYFKDKFELLIESFEKDGPQNLWIAGDCDGRIVDGSHRFALCLYYGISTVKFRFMNSVERLSSDKSWLESHFTLAEQQKILKKYYEICQRL